MVKIVLNEIKTSENEYRLTYNHTACCIWYEVEIHCKFLCFSWWKTIKSFYCKNNNDDYTFEANDAIELLNFIIDPYSQTIEPYDYE